MKRFGWKWWKPATATNEDGSATVETVSLLEPSPQAATPAKQSLPQDDRVLDGCDETRDGDLGGGLEHCTGTSLALDQMGESVGWTIQFTRGEVLEVTDRHVILSADALGVIVFDDGVAFSIEGVRWVGW